MQNINLDKKIIIKFLFLSIFFIIIFYFFIFKNILLYTETNENIMTENIKFEKLNLERKILSQALKEKQNQFNLLKEKLEKINSENKNKESFIGISEFLSYINKNIKNNQLELISFARSSKKNKNINISLNLKGKEKNIKKFIADIEDGEKNINLSKNYFKFEIEKNNLILGKITLSSVLNNKRGDCILSLPILPNEKNIFLDEILNQNQKNSVMRIGNKKFYRNFKTEKTNLNNTNKNKKLLGADKK